jgi:alpha-acetolactate decarboxylase
MRLFIVMVAVFLASTRTSAETDSQQPFNVRMHGTYRAMTVDGDFSPKVRLGDVMSEWPIVGVGAIAEAAGEITILDGKLILSYGREGERPRPESEQAALLVVGSTPDWDELPVAHDVPPQDVERYIAGAAASHGIAAETTLPFEVRGMVIAYAMHVNAAPSEGPHGMRQPMAVSVERSGEELAGTVAGVFVAPELMGIATQGRERTHAHWVSDDETATAHLDRWGIKGGSRLLLPAK